MIVSLGVLGILGTMAGAIFSLTLKSSGQASALIEVSQAVRAFEQTIREDLRHVDPGSCILAIQSNPVQAFWTAEEREAALVPDPRRASDLRRDPEREVAAGVGVDRVMPRADLLMFFTYRPGASFRDPEVTGHIQCVVYGHADTGELLFNGRWDQRSVDPRVKAPKLFISPEDKIVDASMNPNIFSPQAQLQPSGSDYALRSSVSIPNVLMQLPARQWHLARRGLLIVDQQALASAPFYAAALPNDDLDAFGMNTTDDEPAYNAAGLDKQFYIRDGRRDYLVNGEQDCEVFPRKFSFDCDVINYQPDPDFDADPTEASSIAGLMYRSQMDPEPPATQAQRMGHYFLPNCASFKVEWAVDLSGITDDSGNRISDFPEILYNREVLWIDPQRLSETIDDIQQNRDALNDPAARQLMDRIRNSLVPKPESLNDPVLENRQPERFVRNALPGAIVNPNRTHVFYPRDPSNPDSATPDPLFPKALRITVDVFDSGGRLERPIRHVMIVPVGQG